MLYREAEVRVSVLLRYGQKVKIRRILKKKVHGSLERDFVK